jgi:hypothetical protein
MKYHYNKNTLQNSHVSSPCYHLHHLSGKCQHIQIHFTNRVHVAVVTHITSLVK